MKTYAHENHGMDEVPPDAANAKWIHVLELRKELIAFVEEWEREVEKVKQQWEMGAQKGWREVEMLERFHEQFNVPSRYERKQAAKIPS